MSPGLMRPEQNFEPQDRSQQVKERHSGPEKIQGECGGGRVQEPKRPVPRAQTARADCPVLLSSPYSALRPQGGWSCTLWKPQHGLPRDGDAGPRGGDISDPAQSTPVSKHHFTGLLLRAHGPCLLACPDTPSHPGHWLRGRSKALPRGGGCRGSVQSSRGRGLRLPSRIREGNLETPGDPQSTAQHSTTTSSYKYQLPRKAGQTPELLLKKRNVTLRVPSETQPAERCQSPPASFQRWGCYSDF